MKVRISIRYFIKLFDLEKIEVRSIFFGVLGSEILAKLDEKYPTLGDFAEVSDDELLQIPGIGEARVKEIKSTLNAFIKRYVEKDLITGMPENIPPKRRIGYANLIEEGELYTRTIEEIDTALNALPKKQRKFLKMCFGLKNKHSAKEISKKLEIPVSEFDEFKTKALEALRDVIL